MKIHILFKFRKGPWGGGNQFLKALKNEFEKQGIYEEDMENADVVLFNSYPFGCEIFFDQILCLKQMHPNKLMIYRIDGPVSHIRGRDKEVDKIIALFNDHFFDGVIFQSNWCREHNKRFFDICSSYEAVIYNAPSDKIFNKNNKDTFAPAQRTKLIFTSWSPNWRKGFDVYKFIDETLDCSRYEATFVGNSPISFKNIKNIKPVKSEELANILKRHDIYITASRNDPCSNALIEAMSCGLPAIVYNDGGHPELIGKGGEFFNKKEEIIGR